MPVFYQQRDKEFVDYKPWLISKNPSFFVRGPKLDQGDLLQGNYFSTAGAAETVGVHCQNPYSNILSGRLNIPCLNLGKGGAGSGFFIQPEMEGIIGLINKGKFLILTLMSGRQTSNSLFITKGLVECQYNNETMKVDRAWEIIFDKYWHDKSFLQDFIEEVRQVYIKEYLQLLEVINVPVILFYFSQRPVKYSPNWEHKNVRSVWAKFPHLIDHRTIRKIRAKSKVKVVECVSVRGIPYTLKDRMGKEKPLYIAETNQFHMFHSYYPSPEMHEDAAVLLEPACKKILKRLNREP
jgi:hypothetical protein